MQLQALLKLVPFYIIYGSLLATPALGAATPVVDLSTRCQDNADGHNHSNHTGHNQVHNGYKILDKATDDFINNMIQSWNSPGGISVAFVQQDKDGNWITETKGYGIANGNGTKVTEHTYFNIASNTKLFNVLASGLLVHKPELSNKPITWATKIKDIIPEFNTTDPVTTAEAQLNDAMSHRTGYPLHDFSYHYSDNVQSVIQKFGFQRQAAEFRDIWLYNNVVYTILSYVPLKLTGLSFPRFTQKYIFEPLGFKESTFNYQTALNSPGGLSYGMARGDWNPYVDPFGGVPRQQRWWAGTDADDDGNVLSGAGGMLTTAVDMAQWLKVLLLGGKNPDTGEQVMPVGIFDEIAAAIIPSGPYLPAFPEYSIPMYGSAQLQLYYRGHYVLEHGGFIQGFNTQISRLPNDFIGCAVLSNDNEHGMQIGEVIKNYIYDRALGLDTIDWDSRYKAIKSVAPIKATVLATKAQEPSLNFTDFVGSYMNPGYGQLDFCLINPAPANASEACQALSANLTTLLPGAFTNSTPTLLAQYDSPWFSHMKLEHFDNNVWNISLISSTPTVGNDTTLGPFWTYNPRPAGSDQVAVAEFDIQGEQIGLGMTGVWQGILGAGIPPTVGETVVERAEVYWNKI